jgi:hypothetical protein
MESRKQFPKSPFSAAKVVQQTPNGEELYYSYSGWQFLIDRDSGKKASPHVQVWHRTSDAGSFLPF